MYVIFTESIINISFVYISILLLRMVVKGSVRFVLLKGSPNNVNMSSCCTKELFTVSFTSPVLGCVATLFSSKIKLQAL